MYPGISGVLKGMSVSKCTMVDQMYQGPEVIKKYQMYFKCIKEHKVYQMYISNEEICDILQLVYVNCALFLPFLQTINVCAMDLIIIIYYHNFQIYKNIYKIYI